MIDFETDRLLWIFFLATWQIWAELKFANVCISNAYLGFCLAQSTLIFAQETNVDKHKQAELISKIDVQ